MVLNRLGGIQAATAAKNQDGATLSDWMLAADSGMHRPHEDGSEQEEILKPRRQGIAAEDVRVFATRRTVRAGVAAGFSVAWSPSERH